MSVDLEMKTIEKIKSLIEASSNIKSIILFGSRAKGAAKDGSDIDLAIVGDNIGFRDVCGLGSKLDELGLPYKIDIINYNSITNQELKEHISRVGVVL
jgi:predicted nucleotidyltransferase